MRGINEGWAHPLLDSLFILFSQATLIPLVRALTVLACLGLIIYRPRTRAPILLALLAFLAANGITDLFKNGLPQNRPHVDHDNLRVVFDSLVRQKDLILTSPGTVSAHAANTAAVATIFTLYFRKWWGLWVSVALLTGVSRVYVAAHYPSQVLFGWLTGIVTASAFALAWRAVQKKKPQESG